MVRPLFLVQAVFVLALSGEVSPTGPTYAGILPPGVDGGFAARLDSTGGQYFMSPRGGMLVGFAFEHGEFAPKCSLPLPAPIPDPNPDLGEPLATGTIAAAGDVDGDGLDEVIVVGTRTVRKYELMRDAFALTAEAAVHPDSGDRPDWCFDICIGDVTHDGINEVMLSGITSPPPFEPDRVERLITLYVCQWVGKTLAVLWNDRGALELEGPSWVMPITEMRCVCDPTNQGHPTLLMKEGTSDVSAGMYDELQWTSGGFVRTGYFVVRDGRIQWNVPDNNPRNSATECDFAQVGGTTAVLASVLRDRDEEDSYSWQEEYLVFRGNSAAEHRVLWSDGQSPTIGVLIDPDRKGIGALRFTEPRKGAPGFEFYRL
jgi:hypothetical protein